MSQPLEEKHKIIAWFASNPVVANVMMLTILIGGIYTAFTIRKEAFPSFAGEAVTIQVPFLGGTPEDVERGVAIKIEEALESVDGIDHVRSTCTESSASITVEAEEGYDVTKLLDDVKIQLDAIPSFPEQVENPIISERKRRESSIWLEIYGDTSERVLKETARDLRDELLRSPHISTVNTSGDRSYEVSIEVSEDKLRSYEMTFQEVAGAVRSNSVDLSGGVIRSDRGEIALKIRSQAYNTRDFSMIPLRTTADGARIYVRDVAVVRDGFVDQEVLSRFQGKRAVTLNIISESTDDIIKATDEARRVMDEYAAAGKLPEGVETEMWNDESRVIRARLALLGRNGFMGVALVLVMLMLFLNFRLAMWVALGIPISLAGAVLLFPMPGIDISINVLTSFAFILVLGVVVDDAIVIGESIYSEKEKQPDCNHPGADMRGTIRGVAKVVTPATFGVLTTIAAFLPLTQVSGFMGRVFGQIAIAVIFCLIFSLIESKLILPAHLAHIDVHKEPGNFISRRWSRFQRSIANGLSRFVGNVYQPALRKMIPFRYAVIAAFIAVFIVVVGLLSTNRLRFVFFPDIPLDKATATLTLEEGLPVSYLHEEVEKIAQAAFDTGQHFEEETGTNPMRFIQVRATSNTRATVSIELTPSEERDIYTNQIVNLWRSKVGGISGAKALTFIGRGGHSGGIAVQLQSQDLDALQLAAADVKARLADFDGVNDIADSFNSGRPEIRFSITPHGEAAGYDKRTLAANVRDAFYGREAQRIQRGRDEVKVMVRYPIEDRESIDTLRQMRVRGADGKAVPFSVVADTQFDTGLAKIDRLDSRRVVTVTADADKTVTTGDVVLAELQKEYFDELLAKFPEVTINLGGEAEQRGKSMQSLKYGFGVSILLIYILLAITLKAYVKPLFIMSAIPFGIIGALIGHYIVGIPVGILSIFGLLALSGVVVNDSLVLMHRIDDIRDRYPTMDEVIVVAGGERFRAIFLTSITTFVGLAPLLAETEVQAQFLKPMAVALGFGVLFATLITLVLLPMLLLVARDIGVASRDSWNHWRGLMTKGDRDARKI